LRKGISTDKVSSSPKKTFERRLSGENIWFQIPGQRSSQITRSELKFSVLEDEDSVGRALFNELVEYAKEKSGDISIVLLGGRGAQALYRLINRLAETNQIDSLLARLHVFTQDALAPMRMDNGFSFVRDFERLLGESFFAKVKSFTPMFTETGDLEAELVNYIERISSLGGIDIFFLGLGPEAEAASHLCYIKPGSGATLSDFVGIIPISSSIHEHHISKFKIGGSEVSESDEIECRNAKYILTLGPAAIIGARRIVQSVVDASTAPGKRPSFKRLLETKLSNDDIELAAQVDENPGLLIRLHPDVRSYVLPDLVA
jgi:6-phosphogluconolactonase/glucosamine-6-phosphate isomerase/deaminase